MSSAPAAASIAHAKHLLMLQMLFNHATTVTFDTQKLSEDFVISARGQAFGGVAILVGIYLTFVGKRFFKPFLSLFGFVAGLFGSFLGIGYVLTLLNSQTKSEFGTTAVVGAGIACILGGFIGSFLLLWLTNAAITLAAVAGGIFTARFYSGQLIPLIQSHIKKEASSWLSTASNETLSFIIMAAGGLVAFLTVKIFENAVIAIISATLGSIFTAIGIDCFANKNILQMVLSEDPKKFENSNVLLALFMTFTLAVAGFLVQMFVLKSPEEVEAEKKKAVSEDV